ncbi:MarR family winged helix-turn-helix transcriptional regulator [Kitasatospora sp. NPDC005751]|uniref:MarR family winged helix-turn-helix transcriptional regulator n=1 Tax=unclassified Kitasatospora TaxID=2633591 RepID=UPI003405EA1F
MYDRGKGSSSPFEQTVHLLSAAGRAADALLAARLEFRGMSPAHLSVLSTLARLGPHARPDLVAGIDGGAVDTAQTLDDLVAAGLVQSLFVQVGGRHEVLTLTSSGQLALEILHSDESAVQDDLLVSLTRGERTQLNSLLRRVCAAAARSGSAGSAPRRAADWVLTRERRTEWAVEREGAGGAAGAPGVAGERSEDVADRDDGGAPAGS